MLGTGRPLSSRCRPVDAILPAAPSIAARASSAPTRHSPGDLHSAGTWKADRGSGAVQAVLDVLHVDDDPETLLLVRTILEGEPDLRVRSFPTAAEARSAAAVSPPDVLLVDVMMPGTDGPTLLEELRLLPGCGVVPALFVTAKTHPDDLEFLANTTAVGVIRKPFEAGALVSQIRRSVTARAL